ncbi:uncharacterized protein SCHCODRAFT_02122040 [Schizophyllum commune H4-8]|uniref:Uncharacterized protein n=1 Tax=Schizophyllum commune (strain H4-8 / FGSC 9210) TaxID=578458 RepID=D8QK34_SCHCM|nr:uncharacterized protein SCHCODRAFT_02122040 [Schizophyllum commune H4-8]KAI5885691.1 hypothetical protein SCHCODRAFT_02122040 [Schizophyllum commune H4-8]
MKAKSLNTLNPFTPVRNFLQRPAKRRRNSEDSDTGDPASSSAPSSRRLALQTNDADADAVIVTALDTPPFCCHEDLLTMAPAQLARVATSLNARLPMALRIDTNAPSAAIRTAIEVLVGIRNGEGPPPASRTTPSNNHNHQAGGEPRPPERPHAPRRIRRLPTNALKLTLRDEDEDEGGPRALLRMDRDPPSSPLAHRAAPPTPAPRAFPRTPTLPRIDEEGGSPGARPVKRRRVIEARDAATESEEAEIETPTWRVFARRKSIHNPPNPPQVRTSRVEPSQRRARASTLQAPYISTAQAARKSATQAMHLPIQSMRGRVQPARHSTIDDVEAMNDAEPQPFPPTATTTRGHTAKMTAFRERTSTASSSAESLCRERTETTSSVGSVGSVMSTGSAMSTSSTSYGMHEPPPSGYPSEDVQMATSSSTVSMGSVGASTSPYVAGLDAGVAVRTGVRAHAAMSAIDEADASTPIMQQQGWGARSSSPTPVIGKKRRAEESAEVDAYHREKAIAHSSAVGIPYDYAKGIAGDPAGVPRSDSAEIIDGWTERSDLRANSTHPVKKTWTGGMESMQVAGEHGVDAALHEGRGPRHDEDRPRRGSVSARHRPDKRWAMHLSSSP